MIVACWIGGVLLSIFASAFLIARLSGSEEMGAVTCWLWPVSLPFFIVLWLAEKGAR